MIVFLVLFLVVAGQLVIVQVVRADEYTQIGVRQRARTVELPARRGRLYDRDAQVLATSIDAATVYADPRAYRSRTLADGTVVAPAITAQAAAGVLAPLLQRDAATVQARLERDAHFVYVARQLDWETGQRVLAARVPGIGVLVEPTREYPARSLGAQVIGFTGVDGEGLSGLESQHDALLRGTPGTLVVERAPGGLDIASGIRELTPPSPGTDLVLTLDLEVQHTAEQALARTIDEWDALGASVVVMDIESGEILAMASAPSFDPTNLAASPAEGRRNRAVTDMFEPGSIQKAVTAAAALEQGVVTPDTVFEVADTIEYGGHEFSDSHEHETVPMTFREIIETSSNVGTIQVADRLGVDGLRPYLDAFGYGQPVGLDFPGESHGSVPGPDEWWATSLPTIAIGQGVAVTLLQTARVYATIANDGVAVQPRLLRGTVGEDGRLAPVGPPATRRVISSTTADQVREILAGVVSEGTGTLAAVPGYHVAGKTGTALKPLVDARGYSDEYVAGFVGFAPVDAPRFVVAVVVDEPSTIWGGSVAAPVFSEVMGFTLVHRGVAPTAPLSVVAEPAVAPTETATPAG